MTLFTNFGFWILAMKADSDLYGTTCKYGLPKLFAHITRFTFHKMVNEK